MHINGNPERILAELSQGCPCPPDGQVRPAYRRVEVYDETGPWPWPGVITAWWTRTDGVDLCRLRLHGSTASRWALFDPQRIALVVQDGT
ncbi:hypothetical protein ACH4VS_17720 [Streptomyces hygroscopicus]|uniref:hypothetical protein n=1 Tax=Streptomyces hygroscopicus TaxID=1912 RepID=UPI00082F0B3F|nr:hypothetical protein [Streptomyces hygroscopicus]GLV74467.1 hypothetical protein Shyhy02_24680 [Streptomyces hygroscopicus subsp. hygroscopicus]